MISFFVNLMPHRHHQKQSIAGCICIITLDCCMQIIRKNIKIWSELASCYQIPAKKLQVSLPNPLASLIIQVLPLDELPLCDSQAEAGVKLLKQVRKKTITQYESP